MHITESFEYPANLEKVGVMYADPDYTLLRVSQPGVLDPHVDVKDEDGTTIITVTATIDVAALPSAAQRLLKQNPKFRLVEIWGPTSGNKRCGTTTVDVQGAPVKMSATSELVGSQSATTRTIEGNLQVNIPLVGRKIEKKAAGAVSRLLTAEVGTSEKWLSEHA